MSSTTRFYGVTDFAINETWAPISLKEAAQDVLREWAMKDTEDLLNQALRAGRGEWDNFIYDWFKANPPRHRKVAGYSKSGSAW